MTAGGEQEVAAADKRAVAEVILDAVEGLRG